MMERWLMRCDQWWHGGDPTPSDLFALLIHVAAFITIASLGL